MLIYLIGRYSAVTGRFTADRAGLYIFSIYWQTEATIAKTVYLQKNGNVHCNTHGPGGDYHNQACTVLMTLVSGDQVYVTSSDGNPLIASSAVNNGFSGALITPNI